MSGSGSESMPLLQPTERWSDDVKTDSFMASKKDFMEAAVTHVTDAMAYRDFSDYGEYKMGAPVTDMRWRISLHRIYYENSIVKAMRTCVSVVFQLLIFFEQPPWCTSQESGFLNGCEGLTKYHMTQIPLLPEYSSLAVEFVCICCLISEWYVRYIIHGPAFVERKWVRVEGLLLFLNMAGMLARLIVVWAPFPLWGRWIIASLYVRAVLRIAVFVLRSRDHRRDVFGVAYAAEQLMAVLASIAALLLFFAWAGFVLFAALYAADDSPPSINDDLSSFPTALQSFFILMATCTNFPDVMLPGFISNRLVAGFFLLFIVVGNWLGQAMVLASVFTSFKEGAMTHFDLSIQRRRGALLRAYEALKAAARSEDDVPDAIFEEFAGRLKHTLFQQHPHMLANLTDANHDGVVSEEEFAALDALLHLEEAPQHLNIFDLDPEEMEPVRRVVWKIVTNPSFEWAVTMLLVANGILVGYESTVLDVTDGGQESFGLILVDSVMVVLFIAEIVARCVTAGGLRDFWRGGGILGRFDLVVVLLLSVADLLFISQCLFEAPIGKGSTTSLRLVRATLLLRILRLIRLFRVSAQFQVLLATGVSLLPLVLRFLRLLTLAGASFSILGVAIFGGGIYEGAPALDGTNYDTALGIYSYLPVNMNDVLSGMVLLLSVLVQNSVVQDVVVSSAGSEWGRLYFVAWWVVGVCVLLNVLVSFALESFSEQWDLVAGANNMRLSDAIKATDDGAVHRVAREGGYVSEEDAGEGGVSPLIQVRRRASQSLLQGSSLNVMDTCPDLRSGSVSPLRGPAKSGASPLRPRPLQKSRENLQEEEEEEEEEYSYRNNPSAKK